MKRIWIALIATAGLSAFAGAQTGVQAGAGASSSAAASGGGVAVAEGTTVQAELTKSIDARKVKPGDEVTAKATADVTSNGHVVIHKGSKLVGHVTEAQVRTKENQESKLGIVMDRAVLKDGSQVTLNAMVQALAAAPASSLAADNDVGMSRNQGASNRPAPMGAGGMSGVGGVASSTVGSTVGAAGNTVGGVAGGTVNGVGRTAAGATLNSTSQGVIGLGGLTLASGTGEGSVLSSTTQNVKLDSGTQMVLRATSPAR